MRHQALNRKKTSISLPREAISRWYRIRKIFVPKLPRLLGQVHQHNPRRDRFRGYTARNMGCEIISVYWDMDTYNKLHTVAAALRISVSLLISELLEKFDMNDKRDMFVLNYGFKALEWSRLRMTVSETLEFFATPPPLTP